MSKQLREAAQEALAALELHGEQYPHMVKGYTADATTALRAALAEPERQPMTEDAALEAYCTARHSQQYVSVFIAGIRAAERHHGIAAADQKESKCD